MHEPLDVERLEDYQGGSGLVANSDPAFLQYILRLVAVLKEFFQELDDHVQEMDETGCLLTIVDAPGGALVLSDQCGYLFTN